MACDAKPAKLWANDDTANSDNEVEIFADGVLIPNLPFHLTLRVLEWVAEQIVARLAHHERHLQLDITSRVPVFTDPNRGVKNAAPTACRGNRSRLGLFGIFRGQRMVRLVVKRQ